mgnify:CR=1 FL=1
MCRELLRNSLPFYVFETVVIRLNITSSGTGKQALYATRLVDNVVFRKCGFNFDVKYRANCTSLSIRGAHEPQRNERADYGLKSGVNCVMENASIKKLNEVK